MASASVADQGYSHSGCGFQGSDPMLQVFRGGGVSAQAWTAVPRTCRLSLLHSRERMLVVTSELTVSRHDDKVLIATRNRWMSFVEVT